MIFKIILSLRYRLKFKLLICVLISSLLLSLTGCTTTASHLISNDNLPSQAEYEIVKVYMKNGQIIDMVGKSAHYVCEYENKKNLIFYSSADSIKILNDTSQVLKETITSVPTVKIIELDEVRWVAIEKTEIDVGKTALIVVAAVTLVILLYFLLNDTSDNNNSNGKDYDKEDDCYDCNEYRKIIPSGKLFNPSPPDNSLNIPKLILLKWEYSDNRKLKFDIYADTQNPPNIRIAKDISGNSYELGIISPDTKMYWQVVVKDNGNSIAESPVWCFTTVK